MFIPDSEQSIKVYEQKNAIQKDPNLGDYFISYDYYHKSMEGFTVSGEDVIISCAGTIGEAFILPKNVRKGIINQALMRVKVFNDLNKLFFLELFHYAINTKDARGKGSAIKNIPPFDVLKNIIVPIPPKQEQNRIIERIKELLLEIESLKNDEAKLEELQKSFPKKMKDAILQYAIQGKLTQQLPEDGDARDLLKEIRKEKGRLIKEGKIKKEKPLPEITEDEIPFEIPENWCWVRLGSIAFNHGQKMPDTEFTYIDISSINNSTNCLGDLNNILKPENAPSRARKIVHEGDVIYATVRPYLHNICVIDRKIEPEPIVSTGFAVVCTPMRILNFYLYKCFLSPMFDSYANDSDNSRGVAYPAINDDKFSKALIPLPPLAEQNRIIVRLEKLLLLCEELEK